MDWRQRRGNTNISYLLEIAAGQGVNIDACLENTGLKKPDLQAGGSSELWQELAVIRNLIALGAPPGTGLQVGQCYHLTSLGLLGYTMLASRTLWDALQVSQRFLSLAMSICPIRLQRHELGWWMRLDDSVLPVDARSLVVERGLAAWKKIFAELLQRPFVALQVDLTITGTGVNYQKYFSCPVNTGAQHSGMLIASADLEAPLPLANIQTQQSCARLCQQLCDSIEEVHGRLAKRVLALLMNHTAHRCRAAEVATRLGISERTLHRQLAAEGQSFRGLDELMRRQLAEQLLRDSSLGLESIALQLGYSEAAGFSRAYKRWQGVSPAQWRRQFERV